MLAWRPNIDIKGRYFRKERIKSIILSILKKAPTLLCLSRDKIKRQFGKNTTLTLTKTLPKK